MGAVVRDALLEAAQEYRENGSIVGLKGFCARIRDDEPIEFWRGLVKMLPKSMELEATDETLVRLRMVFAGKTEIDEGKSE